MAYRNKVYVAFDGDKDIRYYHLMKAWKQNDGIPFSFNDAHELTQCRDTSLEETIKRSLRERLNNSKAFVLLVGESTKYLYKFVRWEIEQAISLDLPVIVVNLNSIRRHDVNRCPPILNDKLVIHVAFGARILEYALNNWPRERESLRASGRGGAFYYSDEIYDALERGRA